jgi:hypothetical protein
MSDIQQFTPEAASAASFGAFQPTSPFKSTATETILESTVGVANPAQLIPGRVQSTPMVKSLPSNMKALTNKYTELSPMLNSLPEQLRNAIVDFDSKRVSNGQKPLTKEETIKVLQTVQDQKPATPAPERSVWNLPGNFLGDLGAVVKSIPQIPMGIVKEVSHLGEMGEGSNAIERLANAPGVRMLPGSFIVGSLAGGHADELAKHPLFTALDVLPFANEAAKATKVGQAAVEAAEAVGKHPRPLAAFATQRLDEAGQLVDRLPRKMVKDLRDSTKIGVALDTAFGERARNVARAHEEAKMRVMAEQTGLEMGPDSLAQATNQAVKIRQEMMDAGWSEEQILDFGERQKIGKAGSFTDQELAFKHKYDQLTEQFAEHNAADGELVHFDGEWYTPDKGEELRTAQRDAELFRRGAALNSEWRSGGPPRWTVDDLREFTSDALARRGPGDTGFSPAQVDEMHAIVNVADRYGYDVKDVRKMVYSAGSKQTPTTLLDAANALRDVFDKTPVESLTKRASPNDVVDLLRQVGRKDVQANRLQLAIARGDSPEITRTLKNILRRKGKRLDVFTPEVVRDIEALRDQFATSRHVGKFSTRRAEQAASKLDTLHRNTFPARFDPLIGDMTRQGVDEVLKRDPVRPGTWKQQNIKGANQVFREFEERHLGRSLTPEEAGDVARRIKERRWESFDWDTRDAVAKQYEDIEREVARTWRDLREQGYDPSFVHVTSRSRAFAALKPEPGPMPVTLSQVQDRQLDMSPGINDTAVSLSHQGIEMLSRRASEDMLDHVLQQYGVPEYQIREMYAVPARDASAVDPYWGFEGHLKDIVQKRWMPVDLNQLGFDWRSAKMSKYAQETTFVPRSVYDALSQTVNRPTSKFAAVLDPVTKAFRVSVIALSPRVQLYNMLGGATMLMGETGPAAFKYMKDALAVSKNPELATTQTLRRLLAVNEEVFGDFHKVLTKAERAKKAAGLSQIAGGRTLGRIWSEIQNSKAGDLAGRAINKSFEWNGLVDNMYRAMGYMHGYDKALAKGMTKEMAERAGLELTRTVMMDWGSLTPVERTIMKSVFPFYSFMNHAVRYVFRYPIDHPLRASILGAFGKAQQDDLNGMLPDRFLSYFFFGEKDARGNQKAINLGPLNPFGDVANMLTFTGFLAATNPLIATVLDSVGLDQGEAELYPSLRYNPESGRLEGVRTNPLIAFAQNVIPQSQILLSLMGAHTNLTNQIDRDPEGAWRTIASAGGLPVVWRDFNVPQEQFKGELARQDSQNNALNDALRSGNWSDANNYPGLAGTQQRVNALPENVRNAFTPPEQAAVRAQLEALLAGQQGGWMETDGASEALQAALDGLEPNPVAQSAALGGI